MRNTSEVRQETPAEIRAARIQDTLNEGLARYGDLREDVTIDHIKKRKGLLGEVGSDSVENFVTTLQEMPVSITPEGQLYDDLDYTFFSEIDAALTPAERTDFHKELMNLRVEAAERIMNPDGADMNMHPEKSYREAIQNAPREQRFLEEERIKTIETALRGTIRAIIPDKLAAALSQEDMDYLLDDASQVSETLRIVEKVRTKQKKEDQGDKAHRSIDFSIGQLQTQDRDGINEEHYGPQKRDNTSYGGMIRGTF